MKVKLSLGSAISLELLQGKLDVELKTLYLMLGRYCSAKCKFCAQAKDSKVNKKFLSRIIWSEFELGKVLGYLRRAKNFKRLCIQTLKYPGLLQDLVHLIKEVRKNSNILISACVNQLKREEFLELRQVNVDNIGIGLDCVTEKLFYDLKPSAGKWEDYFEAIRNAIEIFGSCSVHLIIGLGESDFEAVSRISELKKLGATPVLFSFTPLKGLALNYNWPSLERYRAIQLARFLLVNENVKLENFEFKNNKLSKILVDRRKLEHLINSGKPFQTSGCKYCTRPFYNERVRGPLYNYPRESSRSEVEKVKVELRNYGVFR